MGATMIPAFHTPYRYKCSGGNVMTIIYTVQDMSCGHCERAVSGGLMSIPGVEAVDVDLAGKRVTVHGEDLDDAALRAAIEEAGYEAA